MLPTSSHIIHPKDHELGINSLRLRQNGRHFADDILNCISLIENIWILIKISLKFVPRGQINNIPALVRIMAWRRPGNKPLSEPMMDSLLTHICIFRPQWVNLGMGSPNERRHYLVTSPLIGWAQFSLALLSNISLHWLSPDPEWSLMNTTHILIAEYKTGVTPVHQQWSYCSFALNHWYVHYWDLLLSWKFHWWCNGKTIV